MAPDRLPRPASGEACGQPWSETKLDDHSLTVSARLVQDGWEVETSEPKTDSGFRVVAVDDDTVSVLEAAPRTAGRRPRGVGTGMVFTQEDGYWLHHGKVTDLFERLVAASGLPPSRLYDPRHGAATLMLAVGIDVKIVCDTLGHSGTRITRDIYQSVLPQVGKNAAEATAKLVPLQRKTEAEEARKAAKKAKDEAKAEARAKRKGKRKKPEK
ncbi:tyrosine-type recombinase/integrase [Streptomyces sp. NPDC046831]|uniref:tyrosine-type recombinase/integrase n=1 Tax=Streptomyces sp. NPDC046831 TaxID=3154805 RepID=UPI0033EFE48E